MIKWLQEQYHKFLWALGFKEGETFSAMFTRQKERLGAGWWALVCLTFLGIIGLIVWCIAWLRSWSDKKKPGCVFAVPVVILTVLIFLILLLPFCGWLLWHILTFKKVED